MADSPEFGASGASGPGDETGTTGAGDPASSGPRAPEQAGPGGQPPAGDPYGQPGYWGSPYGQAGPYGQDPSGQVPYAQNPYAQPPNGPYGGQPPHGPYGGLPPYGGSPYGGSPYGGSPYGQWAPPAPKPGVIPLRPLNVSEILDGAFTAMRRNPKATLGLAAIVMTMYGVITTGVNLLLIHLVKGAAMPSDSQTMTAAQARQLLEHLGEVVLPSLAVTVVVAIVADTILTGMLTAVVGHGVLGRQITIAEAWRIAWPRFWTLVGSSLLALLVIFGTVLAGGGLAAGVGAVLIVAHVAPVGVLVIALGVLTAVVFAVIFAVRLVVAASAVVLEGQGPATSLSRSWRLVKRSSWRVFGIVLLTEIIVLIAGSVLEVPFSVIIALTGHSSGGILLFGGGTGSGSSVAVALIAAVGGIVAGSVTHPVAAGARVLLYVDLRMRREGLDIVLQSAAGEQGQPGAEFGSIWTGAPARPDPETPPDAAPPDTAPPDAAPPYTAPPDQQRW